MPEEIFTKSVTKNNIVEVSRGGVMQIVIPFVNGMDKMALPPEPPPYWSLQRDFVLRTTIYKESMWAAAMSIAITKIGSLSWEVRGEVIDRIKNSQEIFLNADGKKVGWVGFIAKHLRDYLNTDNGAFIEIVRTTGSAGSKIVGLRHLDSLRVTRTGDPDVPALYRDRVGAVHELKDYQIIAMSDMPDPSETYYGIGLCLDGESTVRMASGKSVMIKDLVSSKSTEEVVTMLPDGSLTTRKIVGWHTNEVNGRRKVNIRGTLSKYAMGYCHKNSWVTEDHEILTPSGWTKAIDLKQGDEIITEYPDLNQKQLEIAIGAVLGDGCVNKGNKRARITLSNSQKQEEWLNLKIKALGNFGWNRREYKNQIMFDSKVQPAFNVFREKFYDDKGKSVIPLDLFEENLSPLLLATWYLDDGFIQSREKNERNRRPVASISTTALPDIEVLSVCQILNNKGYECHPTFRGERTNPSGYTTKAGYSIRFTANGSAKLFKDIAPYVPECMRYKIPYDSQSFDKELWNTGNNTRFVDTVELKYKSRIRNSGHVYCIDVEETHNFITASIVVHNCASSRAYYAIYKLAALENYLREKVSGLRPLAIHVVNGILDTQLKDAVKVAQQEEASRGAVGYMGAVIIGIPDEIQPQLVTIPLAELPDGFERKQEFDISVLTYADVLGLDPQELQPLSGHAIGTGAQSQILEDKARGKGLIAWKQDFTHLVNEYLLPDKTTFTFTERDYRDLSQKAGVSKQWADVSAARIGAGITTIQQEQQILVDLDELPKEFVTVNTTGEDSLNDLEKDNQLQNQADVDAKPEVTGNIPAVQQPKTDVLPAQPKTEQSVSREDEKVTPEEEEKKKKKAEKSFVVDEPSPESLIKANELLSRVLYQAKQNAMGMGINETDAEKIVVLSSEIED